MKQKNQEKINGNTKDKKENKDTMSLIVVDLKQEKEEFYEEFSFKTKTKIWF
tara:strand:+ start:318 stop:473 length:156 start_codon:yes stop_codon:yes gene_type:complete